jgi:hypothetical protein
MSTVRSMCHPAAIRNVASMTRNFPPGDIRVGDADRDAAIAELGEHFQAGRLTKEEFDERSGLALRARTGNDLSELFTDLPQAAPRPDMSPTVPPAAPGAPAPTRSAAVARRPFRLGRAILAIVVVGMLVSGLASLLTGNVHHVGDGWVVPVIVVLVLVRVSGHRRR